MVSRNANVFIAEHHLEPTPAPSNAAACRDIKANEIAFGPSICGELYNVTRIGTAVQDYQGAQTDFLVLAPRKEAGKLLEQPRSQADMEYESVLTLFRLSQVLAYSRTCWTYSAMQASI